MPISRDALRGYILEEVLAYLIRNAGYRLLVRPEDDPQSLGWKGNGLVVFGRGAVHQADVLGELRWIPAFTYPLRLFVEAKFRRQKTRVDVVRNTVSVLLDINQNNLPRVVRACGGIPELFGKYHYVAAIFSTSGFSEFAIDFALAHGVSLIDLSTPQFERLRDAITAAADRIVGSPAGGFANGADDDAANEDGFDQAPPASGIERAIRDYLRLKLGTGPRHHESSFGYGLRPSIRDSIEDLVAAAQEMDELFVGIGRGPHMFILQAEGPVEFLRYCEAKPSHDISISWSEEHDDGRTWFIAPRDGSQAYRLSFRLPARLADLIFSSDDTARAAMDVKRQHMSEIFVYRHSRERDLLIRLRFTPPNMPQAQST